MCSVSPQRVQLRRARGYRLPPGAIAVSRPSRFGNPYKAGQDYAWADGEPCPFPQPGPLDIWPGERMVTCESTEQAIDWYRSLITQAIPTLAADARRELAGHDLACWCPLSSPCHGDVLLELCNGEAT